PRTPRRSTTGRSWSRARAATDRPKSSSCSAGRTGARGRSSTVKGLPAHRRACHEAEQGDRAALVEVLVPVAALRRLDARRAAVVARTRGDEIERGAHVPGGGIERELRDPRATRIT